MTYKKLRLIPRLDIKGENLIKGVNLEGLRKIGNPEKFAKKYYLEGADEILIMDCVASLYERQNIYSIINKISKEIFVPITVGGGIRNIEHANNLFKNGADKIAVNTAVTKNPKLIWAKKGIDLGVGEILLTSIDNEGTRKGFELNLINKFVNILKKSNISIPIIVSGGMGKPEDLNEILQIDSIDSVAIADIIHYERKSLREIKKYAEKIGFEIRSIL